MIGNDGGRIFVRRGLGILSYASKGKVANESC